MRIYKLKGGGIIKGDNATDLIKDLRSKSLNPCDNLQDYKEQVAKNCKVDTGAEIQTGSDEWFIHSLERNGFIKREDDNA